MKKIRLLFMLVWSMAVCLPLVSCVKEQMNSAESSKVSLPIGIGTRGADTEPNQTINSIRVISFTSSGGFMSNRTFTPDGSGLYEYVLETYTGNRRFYFICNETAAMTTVLSSATTEAAIKEVVYNYPALSGIDENTVLPMFEVVDALVEKDALGNVSATPQGGVKSTVLTVPVKRVMSRLSITLIKNTPTTDNYTVSDVNITIRQIPSYSFLSNDVSYPLTASWATDIALPASGMVLDNNGTYNADYTTAVGVKKIEIKDIYLPKHIASQPGRCTYLMVTAKFTAADGSGKVFTPTYRLDLGKDVAGGDYNLYNNDHYMVYGRFTGVGNVGLYADIKTLNIYDVAVGWKPIDGLVIVSDLMSDYGRNVDIWNASSIYTGVLKLNANNVYSDVLFKYGSVVGVNTSSSSFTGASDILWSPSSFSIAGVSNWSDVPYLSSGDVATGSDIASGKGDPCKLVRLSTGQISSGMVDNGQWHMAKEEEMQRLVLANDNLDPAFIADNRGYNAYHSLLLPATKSRDASGNLTNTPNWGEYWTSEGTKAFTFSSAANIAAIDPVAQPNQAMTVRCVRNIIPASVMTVTNPSAFSYQGDTTTGLPFTVTTNIPYWTATLITSGTGVGTATDFNDFSFTPFTVGSGTNLYFADGQNAKTLRVYVARKEITYAERSRTFNVLISGVGYDGQKIERIVTVSQSYFLWNTIPQPLSASVLQTNGKIPKAGDTYTVTVDITPTDVVLPDGYQVWAYAVANGVTLPNAPVRQNIVPGVYSYTFELPITANTLPDERNVLIYGSSDIPNFITQYTSLTARSYYQDNK